MYNAHFVQRIHRLLSIRVRELGFVIDTSDL